jgi:hypothetical protein
MVERLDESKLELLRRWGDGLVGDPREEMRAAGRAIVMLVEEVERLQVYPGSERSLQGAAVALDDEAGADDPDLQSSLGARLLSLVVGAKPGSRASPPERPAGPPVQDNSAAIQE